MQIVKRKWAWGLLLLGIVLGGCYFLKGCYILQTPPARDCPIERLVLDERVFPGEATAEPILSPLPRAAWESAGRDIFLKAGGNSHIMFTATARLSGRPENLRSGSG